MDCSKYNEDILEIITEKNYESWKTIEQRTLPNKKQVSPSLHTNYPSEQHHI